MKETPYNEETIDDEEKQSLFEKLIISATNTPQQLTPEYLYSKGENLYSNAIILYQEKKELMMQYKKIYSVYKIFTSSNDSWEIRGLFFG
ncbi:hypothetical protein [Rickettsia asembonensis]|uniref:hypothetical protein n=1 Tax=Rickettsia asembonensis TaxID=1068590 RepID=UPI0023F6D246|nr:hypothetical protein [Rickettsia asembonensis]WCR57274.1 MAG: hypothetical protein PG979_001331 [Rickettsia asembonensis]